MAKNGQNAQSHIVNLVTFNETKWLCLIIASCVTNGAVKMAKSAILIIAKRSCFFFLKASVSDHNRRNSCSGLHKKYGKHIMNGRYTECITAAVTMRRLRRRKNPKASRISRRMSLAPAWPVWRRQDRREQELQRLLAVEQLAGSNAAVAVHSGGRLHI